MESEKELGMSQELAAFVQKNVNFDNRDRNFGGNSYKSFENSQSGALVGAHGQQFGNHQARGFKKGKCEFCEGNHFVNTRWKKFPHLKPKFGKANMAMDEDLTGENNNNVFEESNLDDSDNVSAFTQAQLNQLAQILQQQNLMNNENKTAYAATTRLLPAVNTVTAIENLDFACASNSGELDETPPAVQGEESTQIPNTRKHNQPKYLKDYHCYLAEHGNVIPYEGNESHPLSAVISYKNLSHSQKKFSFNITTKTEPNSYKLAKHNANWQEAMKAEIEALNKNKTWNIVSLPTRKVPIGYKWVYKIKRKSDGSIERYKARLVAKGYTQQPDIDYLETFSLVAKITTDRVLRALAAK